MTKFKQWIHFPKLLSLILPFTLARLGPSPIIKKEWDKAALKPRNRDLEIDEYPIPLEPFHLVFNHQPQRGQALKEMEGMAVLSATRNYMASIFQQYRQDDFLRVALYLFIREEDEFVTKVAFSGTSFFATPTPLSMQKSVQDEAWMGFLGDNEEAYLLHLETHGILGIDSVTLMNVGGQEISINQRSGELVVIDSNATENPMPDMSMDSGVSRKIYLCAIIIPVIAFVMVAIWWSVKKLRFDVVWIKSRKVDPNDEIWRSSQKLEKRFTYPTSAKNRDGKINEILPVTNQSLAIAPKIANDSPQRSSLMTKKSISKRKETNTQQKPIHAKSETWKHQQPHVYNNGGRDAVCMIGKYDSWSEKKPKMMAAKARAKDQTKAHNSKNFESIGDATSEGQNEYACTDKEEGAIPTEKKGAGTLDEKMKRTAKRATNKQSLDFAETTAQPSKGQKQHQLDGYSNKKKRSASKRNESVISTEIQTKSARKKRILQSMDVPAVASATGAVATKERQKRARNVSNRPKTSEQPTLKKKPDPPDSLESAAQKRAKTSKKQHALKSKVAPPENDSSSVSGAGSKINKRAPQG